MIILWPSSEKTVTSQQHPASLAVATGYLTLASTCSYCSSGFVDGWVDGWMNEWMDGNSRAMSTSNTAGIQFSTVLECYFFLGPLSRIYLDSGAATGAHAGTLMDLNFPCLHGCAKQTILVCRQNGRESNRDIEWVKGRIEDFFLKPQGSFGV